MDRIFGSADAADLRESGVQYRRMPARYWAAAGIIVAVADVGGVLKVESGLRYGGQQGQTRRHDSMFAKSPRAGEFGWAEFWESAVASPAGFHSHRRRTCLLVSQVPPQFDPRIWFNACPRICTGVNHKWHTPSWLNDAVMAAFPATGLSRSTVKCGPSTDADHRIVPFRRQPCVGIRRFHDANATLTAADTLICCRIAHGSCFPSFPGLTGICTMPQVLTLSRVSRICLCLLSPDHQRYEISEPFRFVHRKMGKTARFRNT